MLSSKFTEIMDAYPDVTSSESSVSLSSVLAEHEESTSRRSSYGDDDAETSGSDNGTSNSAKRLGFLAKGMSVKISNAMVSTPLKTSSAPRKRLNKAPPPQRRATAL
ncbi:hypothetical protein MMC24_007891 [Lignoscripta atroalba]|nr:hypothetical protein [Lignoscripta atroalba]